MNRIRGVGLTCWTSLMVLMAAVSPTGCGLASKVGSRVSAPIPTASEERVLIDLTDRAAVRARRPLLIAHRGGVVTANTPECSLAQLPQFGLSRDFFAMGFWR